MDFFANPVTNRTVPRYSRVINKPMDFTKMRKKLAEYGGSNDTLGSLNYLPTLSSMEVHDEFKFSFNTTFDYDSLN